MGSEASASPAPTMAAPQISDEVPPRTQITSFAALIAKAKEVKEIRLKVQLEDYVHVVSFAQGRIDLRLSPKADKDLVKQLQKHLKEWTGSNWLISLSEERGAPTMRSVALEKKAEQLAEAKLDPLVAKALELFPGSEILTVRNRADEAGLVDAAEDEEEQ
jgi:DNA polymerase-3 subunit gamma/tau